MCPERVPPDVEDAIKRAAEAGTELLALTPEAAAAYAHLDPRQRPPESSERARVWEWVERIAAEWRAAEVAEGTLTAVEDELVTEDANALLGAIEASLIVSLSEDPNARAQALAATTVAERVEALRADGVFGPDIPPRSEHGAREVSDEELDRFEALSDAVLLAAADSSTVYIDLEPDGRELEPDVARELNDRIELNAITCLAYDADRELAAALRHRRDLRMSVAILRTMQHGFVLSLSSEPERRASAATVDEFTFRFKPVYEGWKAAARSRKGS